MNEGCENSKYFFKLSVGLSLRFCVCLVTLSFFGGFQNNLAEMLTSMSQCVVCKKRTRPVASRLTSHLEVKGKKRGLVFVSAL